MPDLAAAMLLGFFAYGVSLALFVVGLRHLGSARTGAYFSSAPFVGAVLSVMLGAPVSPLLVIAGALMGWGIWMHLTERHEHSHTHTFMEHDHTHVHGAHHQHTHAFPVAPGVRHRHPHQHEALSHNHAHAPDMHHLHDH
ncbi:hypothetical protein GGI1_13224 [Acidithiobacillus sp. GGI-221]|nr:hypothetical protein GGI1_13224 [Acidithiobacillus sp. GGI-221]